jgi:hypothetical protein
MVETITDEEELLQVLWSRGPIEALESTRISNIRGHHLPQFHRRRGVKQFFTPEIETRKENQCLEKC